MAFRQHNPNVVPSRQKGGPYWKSTKINGTIPFHSGGKASVPSVQQVIRHPRGQTVTSKETSLYWGRSSFSTDEYSDRGKANVQDSTTLASTASASQPAGFYRVPALDQISLRPDIDDDLQTSSSRLTPDSRSEN